MCDRYRAKARSILPEKAFLRFDRGSFLFITNAPLFTDEREITDRLHAAGFTAEKRGGLIAFSPTGMSPEEAAFLKTGDRNELRGNIAAAMREHRAEQLSALQILEKNGRYPMKLTYLGHSCFAVENSEGAVLITDPFDGHVGYPVPDCYADAVTVSHGHGDHNYTEKLSGPKKVIAEAGRTKVCGFTVEGYPSFHDEANGTKRGNNMIYRISADGFTIVHLGDLGHLPDQALSEALAGADVLLIPIGGFYTIDTKAAVEIIRSLQPKLAIGMHYRMPGNAFPISDASEFKALTGAKETGSCSIELPCELYGAALLKRRDQ